MQSHRRSHECDSSAQKQVLKRNVESVTSILPDGVKLVQTDDELQAVIEYRTNYYQDDTEAVRAFHNDDLDQYGYVLYTPASDGGLSSTVRLLLDGQHGFPEESILPESVHTMRKEGKKIAELSRLLITEGNNYPRLIQYYELVYQIARADGIDTVLVVMKQKHFSSHKKTMAVSILSNDMGLSWDEEQAELCLVAWDINASQPKFERLIARNKQVPFEVEQWDDYSQYHLGLMVSIQNEVYTQVASRVRGRVLDVGCGSGRIMGYMQDAPLVDSYTGVDLSEKMLEQAQWLKEKLGYDEAMLKHCGIDKIAGKYDSIVSINSYYSWPEPEAILSAIYKRLRSNGLFILATPSRDFDVEKLSRLVKRETLGHPYHDKFLSINEGIASQAHHGPLDALVGQVRKIGFKVKVAHSNFFLGGLSYLELTKSL